MGWAAEAGLEVDYVIGETFRYAGKALIALDVIRRAGLPAVTLAVGSARETRAGWTLPEAYRRLAGAGAMCSA